MPLYKMVYRNVNYVHEYEHMFIAERLNMRHIIVQVQQVLLRAQPEAVLVCMYVCIYICMYVMGLQVRYTSLRTPLP